jgi:hypothetical protein
MSKPASQSRTVGLASAWITSVMTASAIVFLGFRLLLGLGDEDTDLYESPLMLSVGRQLIAGPDELYGPFGGRNPLVLIHAPLYYRVAALAAWPMARAGLHPVAAARLAGRFLSALGLAATLAAAYVLARRGGGARRAGWWAVLLIASSPVLAGQPFTVRPDMLGLALQSWGVVLVLAAIEKPDAAGRRLAWAYSTFGLAFCVKQHLVAATAVSSLLLVREWRRGRIRGDRIVRSLNLTVLVAAVIYCLEWVVTGGRIGDAAFLAAGGVGRVHPGDWLHVGTVLAAVIGKSAGAIGLLGAAVLTAIRTHISLGRWIAAVVVFMVASISVLSTVQLADSAPRITGTLMALTLAVLIIVAGCAAMIRRSHADHRIDRMLIGYIAAEMVLVVILSRISTGAWINYAIQAVIFAAVSTGRALSRALEGSPSRRLTLPASVAVLALLGSALTDVKEAGSRRRSERAELARLFADAPYPSSAFFFADRPGLNRTRGRLDLVFDDWLYPVFESLKMAEPRSRWLRSLLTAGPIRVVVIASDRPRIDGIPETLTELGYRRTGRFGEFRVWSR